MTEKELLRYRKKLRKIEKQGQKILLKEQLKEKKNSYRKKKSIPTSKLYLMYLFIILNIVLGYSMVAMWVFRDLTYLGVLITDVAAQIISYHTYMSKAKIENSKGGITYETAMFELQNKNNYCNNIGDVISDNEEISDDISVG